jgi:glycosyltransferase involved in cell wall biosynthesis
MGELRPIGSRFAAVAEPLPTATAAGQIRTPKIFVPSSSSLKILHILRAPLGGLFRHVLDVAKGQAERGHQVGLILDSMTGGERAEAALAELAPHLALGFVRIPITRQLGWRDIGSLRYVARRIEAVAPDVLHGHGAKGAALARLAPASGTAVRAYTPHGGSLIYAPGTVSGGFYRTLEWLMISRTDLFLFESNYVADLFRMRVGKPRALTRIVHNGVGDADFVPVTANADATDIVCIGELRPVKAIDILIEALAVLKQSGRPASATIAGEGPEGPLLKARAQRLGVADRVRFVGHVPAREAFAMGRIFVIPSRAESLPYVVLEAAAAGLPIIATKVGGVPEIFGSQSTQLIAADDVTVLVNAIGAALDDPAQLQRVTHAVTARVREEFSANAMVDGGLAAYREAIAKRKVAQFT